MYPVKVFFLPFVHRTKHCSNIYCFKILYISLFYQFYLLCYDERNFLNSTMQPLSLFQKRILRELMSLFDKLGFLKTDKICICLCVVILCPNRWIKHKFFLEIVPMSNAQKFHSLLCWNCIRCFHKITVFWICPL